MQMIDLRLPKSVNWFVGLILSTCYVIYESIHPKFFKINQVTEADFVYSSDWFIDELLLAIPIAILGGIIAWILFRILFCRE